MKIGFIGLGIMGSRMAANLQKHGYSLVVFNRTRAKAQPLIDKGATFAESPGKAAEQVDILFTMLAHPDAVEQAALGRDGFLDISSRTHFGLIAVRSILRSPRRWSPRRRGARFILSTHR